MDALSHSERPKSTGCDPCQRPGAPVLVRFSTARLLAVLTVGFAYEWKKGALEWE